MATAVSGSKLAEIGCAGTAASDTSIAPADTLVTAGCGESGAEMSASEAVLARVTSGAVCALAIEAEAARGAAGLVKPQASRLGSSTECAPGSKFAPPDNAYQAQPSAAKVVTIRLFMLKSPVQERAG